MREIEKFLSDLPGQDEKVPEQKIPEKDNTEESKDVEEKNDETAHKNRRHRRLEEQLQRERESNIALNERIKTLSEVAKLKESVETDNLDPRLAEIFGTTDEGKALAQKFGDLLKENSESVRQQTLRELRESQKQEEEELRQEETQYENYIDEKLEELEDRFDVDLTGDSNKARETRREFLELVQTLSPKDSDGVITDYADFDSVFEIYQQTKVERPNERRNQITSRLNQKSQGSTDQGQETSMNFDKAREMLQKLVS